MDDAQLARAVAQLSSVGSAWDARLQRIKRIAEAIQRTQQELDTQTDTNEGESRWWTFCTGSGSRRRRRTKVYDALTTVDGPRRLVDRRHAGRWRRRRRARVPVPAGRRLRHGGARARCRPSGCAGGSSTAPRSGSAPRSTGTSTRTATTRSCMFKHQGWKEPVEFMHHCSTKWGSFLMSLKSLVETGEGAPVAERRADQRLALSRYRRPVRLGSFRIHGRQEPRRPVRRAADRLVTHRSSTRRGLHPGAEHRRAEPSHVLADDRQSRRQPARHGGRRALARRLVLVRDRRHDSQGQEHSRRPALRLERRHGRLRPGRRRRGSSRDRSAGRRRHGGTMGGGGMAMPGRRVRHGPDGGLRARSPPARRRGSSTRSNLAPQQRWRRSNREAPHAGGSESPSIEGRVPWGRAIPFERVGRADAGRARGLLVGVERTRRGTDPVASRRRCHRAMSSGTIHATPSSASTSSNRRCGGCGRASPTTPS